MEWHYQRKTQYLHMGIGWDNNFCDFNWSVTSSDVILSGVDSQMLRKYNSFLCISAVSVQSAWTSNWLRQTTELRNNNKTIMDVCEMFISWLLSQSTCQLIWSKWKDFSWLSIPCCLGPRPIWTMALNPKFSSGNADQLSWSMCKC